MLVKLYSAWYCPFAQRIWMALLYKKVSFELIEIDPYQETEEWMGISKGTGQVPVINVDGENVIDSTLIMNQLDDLFPDTTLLFSNDKVKRVEQDKWIAHINDKIVPYFYRFLKAHIAGSQRDKEQHMLIEGLKIFAKEIEGDYFGGDHASAIDFSLFPFAYRINLLLGHYRGFSIPENSDWSKYHNWFEVMRKRDEFRKTSLSFTDYDSRLIKIYYPYSQGEGQLDVGVVPTGM